MAKKKRTTKIPTAQKQSTLTLAACEQPEIGMESQEKQKKEITVNELIDAIVNGLGPNATDDQKKARDEVFCVFLHQVLAKHPICATYNLLVLHDEGRMVQGDADNIYNAVTNFPKKKPILLVLYSTGGSVASAYLIGKLCREYSQEKFVIVVPRQAKSAATLICCAANEIHMGSLSELGPIDPVIDELPALGLKNSVEHLADLTKRYPAAAEMFAKYLSYSLKPIHLGYYERVAESAKQYAERLLKTHTQDLINKPEAIAYDLVYTYKDHGFVIDKTEAAGIFGDKVIRTGTPEYALGNEIYQTMVLVVRIANAMKYYFYLIGSVETKPNFTIR